MCCTTIADDAITPSSTYLVRSTIAFSFHQLLFCRNNQILASKAKPSTMYIRSIVLAALVGCSTAFVPTSHVAMSTTTLKMSEESATEDRRSFVTKVSPTWPCGPYKYVEQFLLMIFYRNIPQLVWYCCSCCCLGHYDGCFRSIGPGQRRVANVETNFTSLF